MLSSYLNQVFHADALEFMQGLPENSIDCVLIDPPYCSGGAKSLNARNASTNKKYVFTRSIKFTLVVWILFLFFYVFLPFGVSSVFCFEQHQVISVVLNLANLCAMPMIREWITIKAILEDVQVGARVKVFLKIETFMWRM
ncbi:hypothetical protein [Helicobacter cynogastricus]|uniref:hypothetical protein n=1 Tax=Helicobacter cynogastricus TaxID=329937 RepID=UPI001F1B20D7|nr:hypothetical protein [Helicobacter cynogastricus]